MRLSTFCGLHRDVRNNNIMSDTGGGGQPEGGEGAQRGQGRGGDAGGEQGNHDDSLIKKQTEETDLDPPAHQEQGLCMITQSEERDKIRSICIWSQG